MKGKTRETLSDFIEAAHRLQEWKYIESLKGQGGPFMISIIPQDDGSLGIDKVDPDDPETIAFLTTFRWFILKTEPISLYLLDKVAKDPSLSEKWRREVLKLHKSFLHYMDERDKTLPRKMAADFPTRRHIAGVFIHGRVFHWKNKKLRQIHKKWANYGDEFGLLAIAFNSILYTVYNVIVRIAELSEEELAKK